MSNGILFNEVYGSYYNVVAKVLELAVREELTPKKLIRIVEDKAFKESREKLPGLLLGGEWPFLDEDLCTDIMEAPEMPLTEIQKRWLAALLNDPRIRLFLHDADVEKFPKDVKPLWKPDTFVYFDRYSDGDPFENPAYIRNFRTVLEAVKDLKVLELRYAGGKGRTGTVICQPTEIEYSSRDDKFRVFADPLSDKPWSEPLRLNVARIRSCRVVNDYRGTSAETEVEKNSAVLELVDFEDSLDRAMLHFSWLEKRTEKISEATDASPAVYRITLFYSKADETEILIRLLSFGPNIRVLYPEPLREKIKERIFGQLALNR